MKKSQKFLIYLKNVIYQFLFVLEHNAIKNKHITVLVQFFQLFSLIYFYINPLYQHLNNFHILSKYLTDLYPKIVIIKPQTQAIISIMFLFSIPIIIFCLILMKFFIGYQFLLIISLEIAILLYPIIFIKIIIESFNILFGIHFNIVAGVVLFILNAIGSLLILNFLNKKYKFLDVICVIFIYFKIHPYATLSIVFIRIFASYFFSPVTLIRNLRISLQLSLFIVVVTCYFTSDILTNYISYCMTLGTFIAPQFFRIFKDYNKYQNVFYRLQNLTQEQEQKVKFYQFIENHRISCLNVNCQCRSIALLREDQQIKKKGYEFIEYLYKFNQDFESKINLGQVSYQKYDYSLSGLLTIFQLKPKSLYDQYKLYYIKTTYEQQFRKSDKNYSLGNEYFNVYQQYQSFEESIQKLTLIIKQFWTEILYFDGSKKFLELIIQISQKINHINQKYVIYADKYEQYPQFKYLYTTFQIAILNMNESNLNQPKSALVSTNDEINVKVPQRQLFFTSIDRKIKNCNRQLSNFLQINKLQLLGQSYQTFIPEIYLQNHKQWVNNFIELYNKQETKQTFKTLKRKNQYIKIVKMSNRIMPRFQSGLQIITFIKLISTLQTLTAPQSDSQSDFNNFFSLLIQKQTLNIIYMDQSFFTANQMPQIQEIRKKIIGLAITDLYPKFTLNNSQENKQEGKAQNNIGYKEVMLNYTILQEFIEIKEKIYSMNSRNSILSQNSSKGSYSNSRNSFQSANLNGLVFPLPTGDKQKKSSIMNRKKGRKSSFNGVNNKGLQKQKNQLVFLYEIIEQQNLNLDNEYCIVNFRVKSKTNYDAQFLNQFKQKRRQNNLNVESLTLANNKTVQQNQQNMKQQTEISSKQSLKSSKGFNLPWILILPLISIHFIYLKIQYLQEEIMIYLKNSFTFYQKYEKTILKLLNFPVSDVDYLQDLKQLWIDGFGFYHESLLVFEKSEDSQLISYLYKEIIPVNHYGIFKQIQKAFDSQQYLLQILQLSIIVILLFFIAYVIIDFIFNITYAVKTYKKVVAIIFIFLNIQRKDVNRMVATIDLYQKQILQMHKYTQKDKIVNDNYQFFQNYQSNLGNNGQNSVISLIKDSSRSNQFFIDNLVNSQLERRVSLAQQKIIQKATKAKITEKIGIENFKKHLQQFKNSQCQDYNSILQNKNSIINRNEVENKSSFSPQIVSFQFQREWQRQQMNQLNKKQQIVKFRVRYTEKWKQIQQNLNIYLLICLSFILSGLVLGMSLYFISQFVKNQILYTKVYQDIRFMNIVIFKELIQKVTNLSIQPYIKISTFNREFYDKSSSKLSELPEFQKFWQTVYKNNVCPLIQEIQLNKICQKIDNNIVDYGQKVIDQFIQEFLRLRNSTQISNLMKNQTKDFINVVKIQLDLIKTGQNKLYDNFLKYSIKSQTYELIICCLGTFIIFISILLLRKALNQIKGKINDGQNLLSIVPQGIKSKYSDQQIKDLTKSKQKSNKQKLKTKKDTKIVIENQLSGTSLVPNSLGKASPVQNYKISNFH